MFRIRKVPTKTKSISVQVVRSGGHEIQVVKHIGSSSDLTKIQHFTKLAHSWISQNSPQLALFSQPPAIVDLNHLSLRRTTPVLIHELCMQALSLFEFDECLSQTLLDIVFIRLVEPASKLASIQLLSHEFNISHSLKTLQRQLLSITKNKTAIEKKAIQYAQKYVSFDFRVVFYDVTTLYYESFKPDAEGEGIKLPGFSKDNKHQQPQIVLGLVVTKEGFPIEFRIFAGNKFEGHTIIPSLENLKRHHSIDHLTVVADAAMISINNVNALKAKEIGYIVGARLGNLSGKTIIQISQQLSQKDQATIRIYTEDKGVLICQFSQKRYNKDKHETNKQVLRAQRSLGQPGKAVKRLKFIKKTKSTEAVEFNQSLLDKTEKLWGVKGYYTDQEELSDLEVINHYHNLWQVEKAFRISKSDLKIRPIFHRKTENIIAHLLICFMALCIAKHWERQTGESIKRITEILRNISDAQLHDAFSNKTFTLRRELSQIEKTIVDKLKNPPMKSPCAD